MVSILANGGEPGSTALRYHATTVSHKVAIWYSIPTGKCWACTGLFWYAINGAN